MFVKGGGPVKERNNVKEGVLVKYFERGLRPRSFKKTRGPGPCEVVEPCGGALARRLGTKIQTTTPRKIVDLRSSSPGLN